MKYTEENSKNHRVTRSSVNQSQKEKDYVSNIISSSKLPEMKFEEPIFHYNKESSEEEYNNFEDSYLRVDVMYSNKFY
jgi:hypothetical protein